MKTILLVTLLSCAVALSLSAQTTTVFDTVFYSDEHGDRIATMYLPDSSLSNGVGVALGHWWTGERQTMRVWAESLAANGYLAMAFDYYDFRHKDSICKYPKPVTTFKLAVEFLRRNAQRFGMTTGKVVGLGQSEGAIHWGQAIVWDNDDEFFGTDPAVDDRLDAVVLLYGAYDYARFLSASKHHLDQNMVPYFSLNPDFRYTKGSPLANVANVTTPVILFHGRQDEYLLYAQSVVFHESLLVHGKTSKLHLLHAPHAFDIEWQTSKEFTAEGLNAKDTVLAFLQRHVLTPVEQDGWYQISTMPTDVHLLSVCFTDANTGWAVGEPRGAILRTTDGGLSWTMARQWSGTTGWVEWLNGVHFTDATTGTAVGFGHEGTLGDAVVLRTTDGGATWEYHWEINDIELSDVCFANADTGLAVGRSGWIFRTTDGGMTWQDSAVRWDPPKGWHGVSFTDAYTGIVVGDDGKIIRTTNAGVTWEHQLSGTTEGLMSVYFTESATGTAVGESGTILRTTDGGTTWVSQSSGTIERLNGVFFTDATNGYAVGENGTIVRTTDGGDTWTSQPSGTSETLRDVFFTDSYTGTVVGEQGIILRTTTGGVTGVGEDPIVEGELPKEYVLRQNYPNPFNPSTTIEFALPHAVYITLKVYNILGQDVAALIAGERPAGTFKVTWDASSLPSGVYFYRLAAGEYVQTKKMVLMR